MQLFLDMVEHLMPLIATTEEKIPVDIESQTPQISIKIQKELKELLTKPQKAQSLNLHISSLLLKIVQHIPHEKSFPTQILKKIVHTIIDHVRNACDHSLNN